MKKCSKYDTGQSVVEATILYCIFIILMFATYFTGKLIITRQSSASIVRAKAFSNTYETVISNDELSNNLGNEIKARHYINKEKADSKYDSKVLGFIDKILNFLMKTEKSTVISQGNLNRNFKEFLRINKGEHSSQEILYMDDNCFTQSKSLKALLWSTAIILSLGKNTKLEELSGGLFDKSKDFKDRENIFTN